MMFYKRFSTQIIFRIILLLGNVLLIGWIFGDTRLFFNQIILSLILIIQVAELIHFINETNRELSRLFLAIRHSDFSISFKHSVLGKSFKELEYSLEEIVKAYKEVKIEKEVQYQFLQMLVRQIQIGIISMENEDVILINPTAEKLLNIQGIKNWRFIKEYNPLFAREFELLKPQGRKLLELKSDRENKVVAIDVSTLLILNKPHTLVTLQDINSEIEQKEIEAWHKLIRILTHEIMNSVTPISSLTETMQSMLTDIDGDQKQLQQISEDTIADIRFSLNTIQKRSEGLLNFVDNYRKLTRLPKPVTEITELNSFLSGIGDLMKQELLKHNIALQVISHNIYLSIDRKLVEQVLINLITNSIHALEDKQKERKIIIHMHEQEKNIVIEVKDNGKGIADKELKEIFVPFFSTKKDGSGIGLSLSKQIMAMHGGSIKVQTVLNEGTAFSLYFKKII